MRILLVFPLVFAASLAQAAFEFSPIITNLTPSGAGATSAFTVSNSGDTKIPVQVTIVPREPDELGKEVHKEDLAVTKMFKLFPAQLVLNPKETRTIRISYVGNPKLKSEMAFRVIAEELPVDVNDPKKVYKKAVARVSLAVKYVGAVYVTPPGAKPDLLVEAKPEDKPARASASTEKNIVVTVTNKGTAHLIMRKPVLKLKPASGGEEISLEAKDIPTLTNLNFLSGRVRKFVFAWPKSLPVGPVKASFVFKE